MWTTALPARPARRPRAVRMAIALVALTTLLRQAATVATPGRRKVARAEGSRQRLRRKSTSARDTVPSCMALITAP